MTSATTPVSTQRAPDLVGETVVVIGGSAGIGLATARRARAEGADVILTGPQSRPGQAGGAAPVVGGTGAGASVTASGSPPAERRRRASGRRGLS
jgi:NAD(P)-dependent dehydrogenase (short-subunit alcohol dehydrogenase family)